MEVGTPGELRKPVLISVPGSGVSGRRTQGRSYVLRTHLENSCSWDLFGLKQHKNHLLCPTHSPVMDNQNVVCRVLRGLTRFGRQRFGVVVFFHFVLFSCESQGQIEICWLQHLEDGSKLAWNFQTLLGIRAYVQKSIRYSEKVRSSGNLVYLPSWIVIIMFADNFVMLSVTVAFFPPLTLQKQHILVMQLLLTVSSFCFGWIFPCSYL